MRISIVAAVTLDGKIAQSVDQLSLEWTSKEDKRFFVKKTKEAGVLIMGRSTYDTIGRPLPKRLNIIMTRSPEKFEGEEGVLEYTKETPQEILERLHAKGFEEVIIAGGAQIYGLFLKASLVTDLFLTIEPVIFGKGVPLVEGIDPVNLTLVNQEKLGEHAVLLHYRIPDHLTT
jgi:dihydrofolate reductase